MEEHGAETGRTLENKAKFPKRKEISGCLTEELQKVEVGEALPMGSHWLSAPESMKSPQRTEMFLGVGARLGETRGNPLGTMSADKVFKVLQEAHNFLKKPLGVRVG